MCSIYQDGAKILTTMEKSKRGFRDVFYNSKCCKTKSSQYKKQVFAVVSNVLKVLTKINNIISEAKLGSNKEETVILKKPWSKRQCFNKSSKRCKLGLFQYGATSLYEMYLLKIMTWDFLYGQGLQGGGHFATLLKKNTEILQELKEKYDRDTPSCQLLDNLPRYLRVNHYRLPFKQVLESLKQNLPSTIQLEADPFVKNVIKVDYQGSLSQLMSHPLIQQDIAVFQDRASCLVAQIAQIKPDMFLIDMCAAPGSKTLHCLDLLQGQGRVVAFEKNWTRAKTLIKRIQKTSYLIGPFICLECFAKSSLDSSIEYTMQKKPSELTTQGCGVKYTSFNFVNDKKTLFVQVVVMDALQAEMDLLSSLHLCETCQKKQHQKTLKIEKYCCPNVVLVDPSCSGSGLPLHETMDTNTETDLVKKRCRKLSSFQHKILAHVLQQFRTCPIILYSTCSVKIEENECVVLSALQTTHSEHSLENITSQYWPQDRPEEYIDKYISSAVHQWVNVKKIYSMCFHASYAIDHCRGFFLAKLSRSKQE